MNCDSLSVMLYYPKMPGSRNAPSGRCIAFEKYDGTNLHWDWDREFGWHSFGTRRDEFNLTDSGIKMFTAVHANLDGCAALFLNSLSDGLEKILNRRLLLNSYRVFTEYLGANSFAGLHKAADQKRLVLIDVQSHEDIIGPRTFVEEFGHLPIAKIVYKGKLTGKFAEDVRQGKYNVNEGVVCKGGEVGAVWMVKIKTYAYMDKLKQAFADKWEDFWE